MRKGTTNTQEETSSDRTTECDELNMSRLETSSDIAVLFGSLDIAEDIGGLVDLGTASGLVSELAIVKKEQDPTRIPLSCSRRRPHTGQATRCRGPRHCIPHPSQPW
jgi:hypothetical protein